RANQFCEIAPGKWFASGKTDLQNAKRGGLVNDPFPFFCRELAISVAAALWAAWRFALRSGYRIRTIRAMQRASVRNLCEQRVWPRGCHLNTISLRRSKSESVSRISAASALESDSYASANSQTISLNVRPSQRERISLAVSF